MAKHSFRFWLLFILLTLALVAGCSPKVSYRGEAPLASLSGQLIILPVESSTPMSRERLEYLRRALERELNSSGFTVLAPAIVTAACSVNECPGAHQLLERYPNASLVRLKMGSERRANFVAGYYNALKGDLQIEDRSSLPLMTVTYTQSERGGLLFNTGQVLEGLSSTVQNLEADPFERLADQFIRSLAAQLPKRSAAPDVEVRPSIERVTAQNKQFSSEICAHGAPGNRSHLILDRLSVPLLEVRPGIYCGLAPVSVIASSKRRAVISQSLFGLQAQVPLEVTAPAVCMPEKIVTRDKNRISVLCSQDQVCSNPCPGNQLIVFSAPSEDGPFIRAGQIKGGTWQAPKAPELLAVLAVPSQGASSLPAVLKEK